MDWSSGLKVSAWNYRDRKPNFGSIDNWVTGQYKASDTFWIVSNISSSNTTLRDTHLRPNFFFIIGSNIYEAGFADFFWFLLVHTCLTSVHVLSTNLMERPKQWTELNFTNMYFLCGVVYSVRRAPLIAPQNIIKTQKWATLLHLLKSSFIAVVVYFEFNPHTLPCYCKYLLEHPICVCINPLLKIGPLLTQI